MLTPVIVRIVQNIISLEKFSRITSRIRAGMLLISRYVRRSDGCHSSCRSLLVRSPLEGHRLRYALQRTVPV
jgi:hypothetical protein